MIKQVLQKWMKMYKIYSKIYVCWNECAGLRSVVPQMLVHVLFNDFEVFEAVTSNSQQSKLLSKS